MVRTVLIWCAALLLFTAAAPAASAQQAAQRSVLDDPAFRTQAKQGLDLLYDMRFAEAARLFDQIDKRYPRHPAGPFLKALTTWWEILLDLADDSHDEPFYKAMDEVIARSDRMLKQDKDNFDAIFFKGAALGFRGRLRSNRGDWFRAAMDGKRAMDYVLAVARKDPSNHDYVFGKGIYDYYAAVMEARYPFVKPVMVFFPDGDRKRGLEELTRTAEKGWFIQTEAAYFLLQIYYLFEQDYSKSIYYATWLRERHPDNAFFHTFEGRVYARWGQWARSEGIFKEVLERQRKKRPGYNQASGEQALYYLARARMIQGDYQQGLAHLQQLSRLTTTRKKDTYFHVWGTFRQGMAYDALGRRDEAVKRYRQVLDMKDWADVHERAEQYLKKPYRASYFPSSASSD